MKTLRTRNGTTTDLLIPWRTKGEDCRILPQWRGAQIGGGIRIGKALLIRSGSGQESAREGSADRRLKKEPARIARDRLVRLPPLPIAT
jgi:hypothetical protein